MDVHTASSSLLEELGLDGDAHVCDDVERVCVCGDVILDVVYVGVLVGVGRAVEVVEASAIAILHTSEDRSTLDTCISVECVSSYECA